MPDFLANNMAGLAALLNGLILWPIVRSLQKTVNELKARTEKKSRSKRGRI
jgi:hypothetical protein